MLQDNNSIKTAKDPSLLRKFFDNPHWSHSSVRPGTTGNLLVGSWNGVPYDPKPFSRFNQDSRALIVEPRYTRENVLNVPNQAKYTVNLKWEEDKIMDTASKSLDIALNEKQVPQLVKDHTFEYYRNKPAVVKYDKVPASLSLKEGVMTPAERFERLDFEVRSNEAKKIERKSRLNKERHNEIMKHQYPYGALGKDGPSNPETEIYKSTAMKMNKYFEHENRKAESRREFLATKNCSIKTLGYSPFAHEQNLIPPRIISTARGNETHSRLFNETTIPWNPKRAQYLRNESQGGRSYNIINLSKVEYFPPTIQERIGNQRQAHPSISIHGYCSR